MKKILRISGLVFLFVFIIGILFLLAKREEILHQSLDSLISKLKKEDGVELKVGSIHFTGLTEIEAEHISLIPPQKDSLLNIQGFRIGISFWPLLAGKIKIHNLILNHGWVHLIHEKNYTNYSFLLKKKSKATSSSNLSTLVDNFINRGLSKIPDELSVQDLSLSLKTDTNYYKFRIPQAEIKDHLLSSSFYWNKKAKPWHLTGLLRPSEKIIDLKLFGEHEALNFPILKTKFNLELSMDTLHSSLKGESLQDDKASLHLAVSFSNLKFQQAKLSDEEIIFPAIEFDGILRLGDHFYQIDSSSRLRINQLNIHPFGIEINSKKTYEVNFRTEMGPAQTLFDALPQGLFDSMKGIKVIGNLSYHLFGHLDDSDPNGLEFIAGFDRDHFKILKMGDENLQKINAPFSYTPYENGVAMRPRWIGPTNPNFTPLESISSSLKNAVVASEDPNFYAHKGIDEYAFKKVIAIDYKAHSFKRGGSTISMQLVKNVFLSREKTIGRKAEEMLITWLLENLNLTSKQKILETYLNIIEWGPNIYGIGEASHFYFGKSPSELSLGESIFLTHIIPKPKAYQYSFNPDGSLKGYIKGYYRFMGNSLLSKGKILPTDTLSFFQIQLRGPAAQYIIKTPDTSLRSVDTTYLEIGPSLSNPSPGFRP